MPLGTTTVLQGVTRRELHAALWSTYLRLDGVTTRHEVPGGAQPLREALQALDSIRDETPPALVGTALWNLLPAYGNAPPEEFARLLLDVLGLDFEQARKLKAQPAHAVFPPLPQMTLILDSDFSVMDRGSGAWAKLEVCVEREFHTLESIVDPEVWPDECPLFWQRMALLKDGVYGGTMSLPGDGPTDVVMRGRITRGELGAKGLGVVAKLTCDHNDRLEACRLVVEMAPELGRPGWTRIVHERSVTFAPGVLRHYRKQTLAYWMKSEVACLAL